MGIPSLNDDRHIEEYKMKIFLKNVQLVLLSSLLVCSLAGAEEVKTFEYNGLVEQVNRATSVIVLDGMEFKVADGVKTYFNGELVSLMGVVNSRFGLGVSGRILNGRKMIESAAIHHIGENGDE